MPKTPKPEPITSLVSKLGIAQSPLAAAFSALPDNHWRAYIRYVEIAAKEGDKAMQKFLDAYRSLGEREQRKAPPEYICDMAGISIEDLIAAVTPLVWRYSHLKSSMLAATYNPRVIERTAKSAMSRGKNSWKDRETFLKMSGALPTPKGSNIQILNAQMNAANNAPSGLLPAVESEIEAMDTLDDDLDLSPPPLDNPIREDDLS